MATEEKKVIVPVENLRKFTQSVIVKAGAKESHAEALAELIVSADHRGHFSHGLNRLGKYSYSLYLSIILNKILCMFVCVFVPDKLENGWMDLDKSFAYFLTIDTG